MFKRELESWNMRERSELPERFVKHLMGHEIVRTTRFSAAFSERFQRPVCCSSVSLGGALSSLLLQEYKTVGPKKVADQDELLPQQQKSVLIPVSVDSETASEPEDNEADHHEAQENTLVTTAEAKNEGTAKS